MTAQEGERLIYQGEEVQMLSEPLNAYFLFAGHSPRFLAPYTSLWRGYIGTWEILNSRLYLVGLSGRLEDGSQATLATLFPDVTDRVFAHWYSGTLRVPEGRLIEYIHGGYERQFERDRMIEVGNGVVTKTSMIENGFGGSGASRYEPSGGWL